MTVAAAQPVLHCELLLRVECGAIRRETTLNVARMHPLRPAIADFLLNRTPGEFEPTFVKKSAKLVRPRHPDHDRRRICHAAKARLTVAQRFLDTPPGRQFGNESHDQ